jgi:hypothetical protein
LRRRESVPYPRKPTRPKSSMERFSPCFLVHDDASSADLLLLASGGTFLFLFWSVTCGPPKTSGDFCEILKEIQCAPVYNVHQFHEHTWCSYEIPGRLGRERVKITELLLSKKLLCVSAVCHAKTGRLTHQKTSAPCFRFIRPSRMSLL